VLRARYEALETDKFSQVFDAVAAELANQEIWVHLDNHVSKAQWCCGADDGNAWFGGGYTHVEIHGNPTTDKYQIHISILQNGCAVSVTWPNT
jgi:hypothetical protein